MYDTWKKGIYVGAPSGAAWDNENYFDALRESKSDSGEAIERDFGLAAMTCRPTTLLLGLPNNVLCYAALIMDAKGPNSNYTSVEISGHLAVQNAAKRIKRGQLDMAVAGSFSAHTDQVIVNMLGSNNCAKMSPDDDSEGRVIADGSFFFLLENKEKALARGANVVAEYVGGSIASEPTSKLNEIGETPALIGAIERCLKSNNVKKSDVGLVFTSGTDIRVIDDAEIHSLKTVFGDDLPAVGSTGSVTGNLLEAGGLMEVSLASHFYNDGKMPESMKVDEGFSLSIDKKKPYTLIVRASIFGDWSCLLIK